MELKEAGLDVGERRVGRLMRINGIKPVRTRKHKVTTDSHHRLGVAANWLDGEHWDDDPLPAKPEPTARPSPSAWNRSQANQDANAALIAHYAAEEAAENQSREGVLTC